jgi:glycine/D-amino acid oxidase-like deaminating enzyme
MTVVVVGGGVLGMMHALEARRLGHDVVHLEREAGSRGASVRNFGLIWVSGRAPGPELDLARRARARWAEIAGQVPGVGFRANGSLTLATDDAELQLLKEAAARPDANLRGYELLDQAGVRAINPALRGEFAGGLLCRMDALVEPRLVPEALRDHLQATASPAASYRWLPGREATAVGPQAVGDQTGAWHRGDLVVLCTGAAHTGVVGPHLSGGAHPPDGTDPSGGAHPSGRPDLSRGAGPQVRRVRLQMMQTLPYPRELTTSVADGDSLRYYPAYDLPGRQHLAPQAPEAARSRLQLLLVQRRDGGLTIGDTHEYAEPFAFDVDESPYDHLRARAEKLLGARVPRVQRRWAGVYSQVTGDDLYHRSEVAPGVVLVTGAGGRGMTCAPAIAEETFREGCP